MTTPYVTGTVSVTAGSAVVTGSGTAWLTAGIVGGVLGLDRSDGNPIPILSVDSDTQITLAKPWRGATASGQGYWVVRDTAYLQQLTDNAAKLSTYISRLDNASLAAFAALAGTMVADRFPYATSDSAMAWGTVTPFARTLLDDANGSAVYQTLGEIPDVSLREGLKATNSGTYAGDLNALTGTGVFRISASAANIPVVASGIVLQGQILSTTMFQVFYRITNGDSWIRVCNAGTWGTWQKNIRQSDFERGSNANGEYVRFADGTQICTLVDVTLGYSSSTRLVYAWSFPATFPGGVMFADVMLPAGGSNFQNVSLQNCGSSWSSRSSVGGSQIGINNAGATNFASNTQVTGCSLIAFGRWF